MTDNSTALLMAAAAAQVALVLEASLEARAMWAIWFRCSA
jgi:hypothetical protein